MKMKPTAVYTFFFSPTGTSKRIADAVARGLAREAGAGPAGAEIAATMAADLKTAGAQSDKAEAAGAGIENGIRTAEAATSETGTAMADTGTEVVMTETSEIAASVVPILTGNLTHTAAQGVTLPADAAAVFAAPVYGGRIAPAALERMEALRGSETPAVVIAVYGNRDFEGAAAQLAAFVAERGFVPVAAAAFVGEHSYSSPATPIAAGRPDARDIAEAEAFGAAVAQKLAAGKPEPVDAARLRAPRTPLWSLLRFIAFVLRYRRRQREYPVVLVPAGDKALCTECGRCAALCPTQAIGRDDLLHSDPARCIRCNACVKGCPFGARSYPTPFAAALARSFRRRKPPVTLL